MLRKANNYAFIDSQNLNLGIRTLGWRLDFKKFRIYLLEKYGVQKAYLFMGYVAENESMYGMLARFGYDIVFKPTLKGNDGIVKGNCDAELVLQAVSEMNDYEKAVIVTGDGDFHCLIQYLIGHEKLARVLVPNRFKCSALLKRFNPYLNAMNDLRHRLCLSKEKTPQGQNLAR